MKKSVTIVVILIFLVLIAIYYQIEESFEFSVDAEKTIVNTTLSLFGVEFFTFVSESATTNIETMVIPDEKKHLLWPGLMTGECNEADRVSLKKWRTYIPSGKHAEQQHIKFNLAPSWTDPIICNAGEALCNKENFIEIQNNAPTRLTILFYVDMEENDCFNDGSDSDSFHVLVNSRETPLPAKQQPRFPFYETLPGVNAKARTGVSFLANGITKSKLRAEVLLNLEISPHKFKFGHGSKTAYFR